MKIRPQIQFRFLDGGQHEAVKEAAKKSNQSVNGWILHAVEVKLGKNGVVRVPVVEVPGDGVPAGEEGDSLQGARQGRKKHRVGGVRGRVQGGGEQELATEGHDTKACRLYGCGQCAAAGVKDSKRGL